MRKVLRVIVVDLDGNTFSRDWRKSANKLDVIRWTLEDIDLPHSVKVDKIVKINALEMDAWE